VVGLEVFPAPKFKTNRFFLTPTFFVLQSNI